MKLHTLKGPPVRKGTFTVTDSEGKILSQTTHDGDGNGVRVAMCREGTDHTDNTDKCQHDNDTSVLSV